MKAAQLFSKFLRTFTLPFSLFIYFERISNMELIEKTLSRSDIYSGKIIHVHVDDVELPNGSISKREVVDHPGGVSVAALTADNELILVRQFRYPYHKVLLELPAGKLEPGEDPFEAMKREQMEETGTTGSHYVSLGEVYPTGGYCAEIIRLWACRVAEDKHQLHLDDDEFLAPERIPLDKAVEMVCNNEIPDAKTQIGILKTAQLVNKGLL